MSQRIGHGILTFVSGKLQNQHVHFVGHLFRMRGSQRIPRHAKHTGRKHFFAVLIVGEGTRLSHKRIDDVSIVDGRQLLADEPRHGLNEVPLMSHRDVFRTDTQVDELADQSARHRIRVGSHVDGAAANDSHTRDDVVGVEPFIRQSIQMRQIVQKLLPPIVIGPLHQVFHEGDVLFATGKLSTATQQ